MEAWLCLLMTTADLPHLPVRSLFEMRKPLLRPRSVTPDLLKCLPRVTVNLWKGQAQKNLQDHDHPCCCHSLVIPSIPDDLVWTLLELEAPPYYPNFQVETVYPKSLFDRLHYSSNIGPTRGRNALSTRQVVEEDCLDCRRLRSGFVLLVVFAVALAAVAVVADAAKDRCRIDLVVRTIVAAVENTHKLVHCC